MSDTKYEIEDLEVFEISTVRQGANLEKDFIFIKSMEKQLDPKAPEEQEVKDEVEKSEEKVEESKDSEILKKLSVLDTLADALSSVQQAIVKLTDSQNDLQKSVTAEPAMVTVTAEGKVFVENSEVDAVSSTNIAQIEKAIASLQLAKDNSTEGKFEKAISELKDEFAKKLEDVVTVNEALKEQVEKMRSTSGASRANDVDTKENDELKVEKSGTDEWDGCGFEIVHKKVYKS